MPSNSLTPRAGTKKKKQISTRLAFLMLAVSMALALNKGREWPITVELVNWRLDAIYSSALHCLVGVFAALVARAIPWALLRAFAYQAGGLLVVGILFVQSLSFHAPDRHLIAEYAANGVHYRLYEDDSLGAAILTRERGPIFGVKLTSAVWASTSYCCGLSLMPRKNLVVAVVNKNSGANVFTIP